MNAVPPLRRRSWTREQWLVALVLGSLLLAALVLLVVDSARHPPTSEPRIAPPHRTSP